MIGKGINMPSHNTLFTRELLNLARIDAEAYNVQVPKRLVALRSSPREFFVQGTNDNGGYVTASDKYEARAEYINFLVRRTHPQLDE
jgi:hypothetical protein